MNHWYSRLIREPLVHFLLAGVGIYALFVLSDAGDEVVDERTVVVSEGEILALNDQWMRLWRRPPTEGEMAGMIRDHVRTRILYREALAMGLDDGDTVIERRLAQKVELLARGLMTPPEPSPEELRAWYDANLERFTDPPRYSLTQIFFDPDERGAAATADAVTLLAELEAMPGLPADPTAYGDRFMLQNQYFGRTETELRKLFGGGFIEQVVALEPGRWHGPILSGFGTHLVFLSEISVSEPAPFESVAAQVEDAWMAAQIEESSARFIDEVIARYDVVVEDTEVPLLAPGGAPTANPPAASTSGGD